MWEEVEALEEKWSWGKEDLKYAGIEAPEKVKDRLLSEGQYKPAVSQYGRTPTLWRIRPYEN